ncbi:hypothetical protein AMTRI_Chr07g78680 [Amborella trichopoda]
MQRHVLQKIEKFPYQLQDKLQCQRFLGCLNYVTEFIPALSEKTRQIRKYMNKDPFRWEEDAIKELPPLHPIQQGPFIISTNASSQTWVAILLKKVDRDEGICAYISFQFKNMN